MSSSTPRSSVRWEGDDHYQGGGPEGLEPRILLQVRATHGLRVLTFGPRGGRGKYLSLATLSIKYPPKVEDECKERKGPTSPSFSYFKNGRREGKHRDKRLALPNSPSGN